MLGTSLECHKVREFALRPMGDFLLVLDLMTMQWSSSCLLTMQWILGGYHSYLVGPWTNFGF